MRDRKSVIFVANRGYGLTNSRMPIIKRFLSSGWNVVVATAKDAESEILENLGVYVEPVQFNRGGFALGADMATYMRLVHIYRKWRPLLIQHFNAKPVILGSLAAHRSLRSTVKVVNTITGLGHAFIAGGLTARLAGGGYKLVLPHTAVTVFQNSDDRSLFLEKGFVVKEQAKLIVSSGVDIVRFSLVNRDGRNGKSPVIVMLSRLIRQKGIAEFIEVAGRIHRLLPEARFLIAGEEDSSHPDAVDMDWLRGQEEIEYMGHLNDVIPVLAKADVFLFPSYYREGVPRVVLEASAMGLPSVGYDVAGVREAILDGQTGFLVPDRDVDSLVDCVALLLKDQNLRLRMGDSARTMVEEKFDVRAIEEEYLQMYRDLGFEVV